ncbi:MAG: glycosyltransferase family 2 protein [Flavobacteriales bacterium]|nr:glycosyltransferase family 2 protein [Flavobacteriales bacterium]
MEPLVSVVIPVYNCEHHIDHGMSSILNQTYTNIEIICVDNNSTDSSLLKLKEWSEKEARIKVFSEQEQGAPFARNKGTYEAKGEWIQYFDVDDFLYPNKIAHQMSLVSSSTERIDIVFEGWEVVHLDGRIEVHHVDPDIWKALFKGGSNTNSVLIRREALLKVQGWDVKLKSSQERDLFFRIMKTEANFIVSDNIGSRYEMREGSITTSLDKHGEKTVRFVLLRQRMLDYLIEEKSVYFQKNKTWYLSFFLERIRWVYPFNQKLALELYKKYCRGERFEPVRSLSKKYLFLLKLLGLKGTEKVYALNKK